ncbi:hypothetical protein LTR08_000308 [Meristemomyces frigidus]|nr:hypothetical protein LTR08_000308 [Meristemomyces frigidus]
MGCLCIPTPPRHRRRHQQTLFHWPNFTFSHSQHTLNPRRIHSTFSLTDRPRPPFTHKRRHSLHNGTVLADLRKPKRKTKRSRNLAKIASPAAPGTIAVEAMSERYAPPSGPPPGYRAQQLAPTASQDARNGQQQQHHVHWPVSSGATRDREQTSQNPFRSAHVDASSAQGPLPSSSHHAAPPGYDAPPPGPPPGWNQPQQQHQQHQQHQQPTGTSGYAPPPGPPPTHHSQAGATLPSPSGPPPGYKQSNEPEPPPYDPWLAVPDNALLPPPPSLREERSPAANASFDSAASAHAWCRRTPLWRPRVHSKQTLARIAAGEISLTAAPGTRNISLYPHAPGRTLVRTTAKCEDSLFLSDLPIYIPGNGTLPRTIYYEVKIHSLGSPNKKDAGGEEEAGIALGFLAPPYPSWRLPGWHRASLAVHGDDGRRYVDDSFGGSDFVEPFRKGDTVGIGMVFGPAVSGGGRGKVEVFFTRNGEREGGWDLFEERDAEAEEGDVGGLEGGRELLAAVGCFGEVEFEVRFRREGWGYRV